MYDHSGAVVTPPINIDTHPNNFLHIFSCLVFGKLECLGYDPSILNIPDDPLRLPLPAPIGRILVNDHTYDILEVIFSSQGLVGRGTVCYLAWRGDKEYIIKDHWVLGSKVDTLNEVKMLQAMKDVRGVPQLIDHWLVEIKPGKVNQTGLYRYKLLNSLQDAVRTHVRLVLKPHAQPLYMFWTKAELLGAIRDIISSKYIFNTPPSSTFN
ncbi:uncharacterized protein F5891DRAFT_964895 [Suillus fuscotomentosus]|uniref:Fungal-type protein kinase domain-containing protein n=1 Tax=Suillus fuscotomentosus TaxID=1912939 RepID=A0AAD4HD31_9AGAM|nr:uncharacterized protein F5891DRAFT_964895 [Suillus fuscotomentosus]KAG1890463.1 hypothetical protein F5891DRAFT_964895 [Suillus fuscotomentosus]